MSASGTIDELLIRWQELRRHGGRPSVRELCPDDSALAAELTRRIAAFESMEAMLGVGADGTLPDHPPAHVVPPHLSEKLRPLGYELLEVIDHGGMGVVYKATQIELRRTVALKMIAGFRVGPKQLARFRVEAEAVARLHHPHIVQIYEIGEVDGHSFFSMEYVAGGNLAQRLAAGPLPPATAAAWVELLARAVHHAHTRGIVHRDLKPANILLARDEGGGMKDDEESADGAPSDSSFIPPPSSLRPKIADFGLAKRLEAGQDHTATGEVIGTPAYMAPEQAQGRTDAIGPACDVYALGTILYEALTGRAPFKGDTVLETIQKVIADDPVEPRRVDANLPRDLEAVCLKCLEKDPARRYATAEALADDLGRFLAGLPVVARRPSAAGRAVRWARRHRAWVAALALLALAALTGGAFARWSATRERDAGRFVEGFRAERDRLAARALAVAPQAREILQRNCFECHGGNRADVVNDFNVFDHNSLRERKHVVPEYPDESLLVRRIKDRSMPPQELETEFPRVSEKELSILREWIAGGAPDFPPEDPLHPTPPVVPYDKLAAEVKTIFSNRCYSACHEVGKGSEKGGIRIMDHDLLVLDRRVVVPFQPDQSELYNLLLLPKTAKKAMPPLKSEPLKPAEVEKIRQWIVEGAKPFPRTPKEE